MSREIGVLEIARFEVILLVRYRGISIRRDHDVRDIVDI